MTTLTGTDLGYAQRGVTILTGVDVTIAAGERLAVTGPSGSGKTTLLTILAGLLHPTTGSALLDGRPVRPGRQVALVPQGYGLLALLTAAENIEVALRATGTSPAQAASAAEHVLAGLGLAAHADRLVGELSGGQQQRTAIARTLALDPAFLLADEPTAEQDPDSRALVMDRLLAATDHGTAVVIATHDHDIAARCDRVVELHHGSTARHRSAE